MTPQEAYKNLTLKFTSGNSVPVDRAVITATEFQAIATFIETFKENLALINMGLSLSLCNLNHEYTRRDIKKIQEDFQKVKTAWEGK